MPGLFFAGRDQRQTGYGEAAAQGFSPLRPTLYARAAKAPGRPAAIRPISA